MIPEPLLFYRSVTKSLVSLRVSCRRGSMASDAVIRRMGEQLRSSVEARETVESQAAELIGRVNDLARTVILEVRSNLPARLRQKYNSITWPEDPLQEASALLEWISSPRIKRLLPEDFLTESVFACDGYIEFLEAGRFSFLEDDSDDDERYQLSQSTSGWDSTQ